jgi:hypothetical protein
VATAAEHTQGSADPAARNPLPPVPSLVDNHLQIFTERLLLFASDLATLRSGDDGRPHTGNSFPS